MPMSKVNPPAVTKPPRMSASAESGWGFRSGLAQAWPPRRTKARTDRLIAWRVCMARSSVRNREDRGDLVERRQVTHQLAGLLLTQVGVHQRPRMQRPFLLAVELAGVLVVDDEHHARPHVLELLAVVD